MPSKYNFGDTVYIIESNQSVREAMIINCSGGFCTIRFMNGGGIRLRESRLFATEEEAKAALPPKETRRWWD